MDIEKSKLPIEKIAQKHNLKFVVLFGSAASSRMNNTSDIDMAILAKSHAPLDYRSFLNFAADLSETLGAGSRKIDLIDLAKANILLRYEATRNGVLLYGDKIAYQDYRTFAFKDYIDSQSLRDLESILIKKRQNALATKVDA